jgi:hypothetical protein
VGTSIPKAVPDSWEMAALGNSSPQIPNKVKFNWSPHQFVEYPVKQWNRVVRISVLGLALGLIQRTAYGI